MALSYPEPDQVRATTGVVYQLSFTGRKADG